MHEKPISKVKSGVRKRKPENNKINATEEFIYATKELEKMLEEIDELTNIIKQVNDKTRKLMQEKD